MDNEEIVKAFDKFVDSKFAESEDILRTEIKKSVNDHLKNKLELEDDPIVSTDDDNDDGDDE